MSLLVYRSPFHQTFLHLFFKDDGYPFMMLVVIPSGVQDSLSCVGFMSACSCPPTLTYSENMQVIISHFCGYLSEFTCLVQGSHIPESKPDLVLWPLTFLFYYLSITLEAKQLKYLIGINRIDVIVNSRVIAINRKSFFYAKYPLISLSH